MVAHLVHQSADGKLAVIAVLLTKGADNPVIKALWRNLPVKKGAEQHVDAVTIDAVTIDAVTIDAMTIDAMGLLPADRAYLTFAGSLTTPPCSESVTWLVLRHPVPMSAGEIARFAKAYPMNARPLQPRNGREIRAGK